MPIVFLGLSERWGDSVGPRDSEGGRLATDHLLEFGHRRIAYVRTPLVERSGDRARYAGYRSAMRARRSGGAPGAAGSPAPTCRRPRGRCRWSCGQRPRAPTALFVSNDIGAIALIEACEPRGCTVPGDLSVVGFDDIAMAGLHRISLTTVAQPLDFQAERAVSLLLERIENPLHRSAPRAGSGDALQVRESTVAYPPRR